MSAQIKVHKGVLYFPSRQMAEAYAQHCGVSATPVKSLRGWAVKVAA